MRHSGKKMLAATLVAAMMIGGLVGCGKGQEKPNDSGKTNQTTNVAQKEVDVDSVKNKVKKDARSASELIESLEAAEVKGNKVFGEGGKELSKDEVKAIAKLYASKDEKLVSKDNREKIKSMVNAVFGEREGSKILNEYKEGNGRTPTGKASNSGKNDNKSTTSSNKGENVAIVGDKKDSENTNKSENKQENKSANKPSNDDNSSGDSGNTNSDNDSTQKKDVVEYKNESERYTISFKTVDNYASSGGESRVYQAGSNGVGEKVYKVKYVNGVRQGRELVSDSTVTSPQSQIIERYVKVQDEKWEEQAIQKPYTVDVYEEKWYIYYNDHNTGETGLIIWCNSDKEAFDKFGQMTDDYAAGNSKLRPTNWGGPEDVKVGEKTEYETVYENVKVQDAKYEWKH